MNINTSIIFIFACLSSIIIIHADVSHLRHHYARNIFNYDNAGLRTTNNFLSPFGQHQHWLQQQLPRFPAHGFNIDEKLLPPDTTKLAPIITKQFFLVSAPEEPENTIKTKHLIFGRPRKNYRVIFIKAPEPENNNLKLTAEYAPQEEKTVIYVLTKKTNELDITEIPNPAPTRPSKPEVFFIKYKTPDEAEAAQKEIQDQYDQLGGTTEISDEGTAPIKSVIGSLDGQAANNGFDYRSAQSGDVIRNDYLPPRYL